MSPIREQAYQAAAARNALVQHLRAIAAQRSLRSLGGLLAFFFRRAVLRRDIPFQVTLSLTDRCVFRCRHCHRPAPGDGPLPEMTTDEVRSAIDQIRKLGAYMVIFTGGEPLLRPDIHEIIRHARRHHLTTHIQSTGWTVDRRSALALKRAGLHRFAVSLDDADPRLHDEIRGLPGAQRRALDAIGHMREAGIHVIVNCCVSKRLMVPDARGTTGFDKVLALARAHGAAGFLVLGFVAAGRSEGAFGQVLDASDSAEIRRYQRLTFFRLEFASARTNCEAYRKLLLYIAPDGRVTPCPYVPFALGTLREEPLEALWKRYTDRMNLVLRNACPMNDPENRERIRGFIADVARSAEGR
jgi:MoaA/NifB/PqqE/SkfB family radical SAM enzyme